MIKVGTTKHCKKNYNGQTVTIKYAYSDVKFDEDGWVDAKKFMPPDFELCFLKIKNKETKFGWSTGLNWDGLRVEKTDEVLYWKREECKNTSTKR